MRLPIESAISRERVVAIIIAILKTTSQGHQFIENVKNCKMLENLYFVYNFYK